jgi:DNA segregation ATPase FtsK/SpoIIIE, S-DNA-T family
MTVSGDQVSNVTDVEPYIDELHSALPAEPRGYYRVHRPERSWPHPPAPAAIELAAPPTPPEGRTGLMTALLPALGSLAMVGFAFVVHSLVYLISIGAMIVVMVGAGLLTTVSQRRRGARRWDRTRTRYTEHVAAARLAAADAAAAQRDAAQACFPDPDSLPAVAAHGDGLWERRPGDADFAAVRLGRGRVAASCPVAIAREAGPLAEADPDLADAAARVVAETAALPDAPVVIPLGDLGSVAVVGQPGQSRSLVAAWLAGLATFHAPAELRIMALMPLSAVRTWGWLKWLPHTRDPEAGDGFGRVNRAVTADQAAFAAQAETLVRQRLDRLRHQREAALAAPPGGADAPGQRADPAVEHVVIVLDGYRPGEGPPAIEGLLPVAAAAGVTVVLLVGSPADVPASCGAQIDWTAEGTLRYVAAGPRGRTETGVAADRLSPGLAEELARVLAPLALKSGEAGADLADPVRLVELLGADEAENLDIRAQWLSDGALAQGVPPTFLSVPIGRTGNGAPILLDLKEAAMGGMGPHGLLVGATGSGKSELLRSLATALAVRHDPSVLNLLLIDFKGGAAFTELAGFPHVAGLVTNLADDLSLVDRMRLAVAGELARRQEALRLAGNLGSIADYQMARARGAPLDPLPYLAVIVDEFGELLAAKPDFLDTFLTVARLGRSLGVHLLLATQRLDEGRIRALEPHLRYRLCLRTFTAEESRAVLGTADAYELPALPGLGYLRVDSGRHRFKAAVCGAAAPRRGEQQGADAARNSVGSLLRPLSLGGTAAASEQSHAPRLRAADVRALVDSSSRAATRKATRIWTPPLPADLTLGALRDMLGGRLGTGTQGSAEESVVVGLADFPERQTKRPVRYRPGGAGGNLGVAGAPRTGKSALLQSLLLALCATASPQQRQFYCLDLGGGGLVDLAALPHVGAVVGRGEAEGAARLLRELRSLLDERAAARQVGQQEPTWPDAFLVVDNVGQLRQTAPDLEQELIELATAGLPFGLHVLATANRWLDIRPQLLDALGTRWELNLADPAESLAGRQAASRVPADAPGRGLLRSGHLFQAALPALTRDPTPGGLAEAVAVIAAAAAGPPAPTISALPSLVTRARAEDMARAAGTPPARQDDGLFLLGVSEFRSHPARLDLARPGARLLVFGDAESGRTTVARRAVSYLLDPASPGAGTRALHIIDPRRGLLDRASHPAVAGYAAGAGAAEKLALRLADELRQRAVPDDASLAELTRGRWWSGPGHVLVVDDYDLLIGSMGGPFAPLAELLAQGPDIGFGVILTRRVAGSQRTSFEAFGQRLREVADHILILSGQPDEGPLAAGVTARLRPPGRGVLVSGRGRPRLVQCLVDDEAVPDRRTVR